MNEKFDFKKRNSSSNLRNNTSNSSNSQNIGKQAYILANSERIMAKYYTKERMRKVKIEK